MKIVESSTSFVGRISLIISKLISGDRQSERHEDFAVLSPNTVLKSLLMSLPIPEVFL